MLKKLIAVFSAAAILLTGCTDAANDITNNMQSTEAQPTTAEMTQSTENEDKKTINIGITQGAGSIGIAHMLANGEDGSAYEIYSTKVYGSANELMGGLANGEVDAAILPPDKAAKLYTEYGCNCKVAAIASTCNYYIVEKGETVSDIKALDKREIAINENDKLAEPVLNKIAGENGISFSFKYMTDNEKIIQALTSGEIHTALLQEPYCSQATAADSGISVVLDLYDSWQEAAYCTLATSCLVLSDKFMKNNSAVLGHLISDYNASVAITKHNPSETADLSEKYSLFANKQAVEKGIPGCGISFITGDTMKEELQRLYSILLEQNPDCVGGAVPDDSFYRTTF